MLIMLTAGETVFTEQKIYQGRVYADFTEHGIEQMDYAASTLSHYNIDKIYSSDLYDAQDMLQRVQRASGGDVPYELVMELRERSGGLYEGKTYAEIRKGKSPRQYRVWERDPNESPEGGESLYDVKFRLDDWIPQLIHDLKQNKTVLVISHPDTMKVLIAIMRGDKLEDVMSTKIETAIPYFWHGIPND